MAATALVRTVPLNPALACPVVAVSECLQWWVVVVVVVVEVVVVVVIVVVAVF